MKTRRAFIRSAAATLALPALESITPRMANAAVGVKAGVSSAKRMVCVGNSFGMYAPQFFPTEAGKDYKTTPLLKPLDALRKDFTVFSHLDHDVKGGHYSVHSFLSGVKSSQAAARPDGNITLDQRAAEIVGLETRFPSLTIGSTSGLHGGCQMSWTRSGVRVPPITGPRELFHKLFMNENRTGLTKALDRFDLKGSILDAINGDAKSLSKRVSGRDREKLDEYFSSIRDVEKKIQQQRKWHSVPKPTTDREAPNNQGLVDDIPVLYDLLALTLEIDATRIASFEMSGAQFNTRILGIDAGYHALSHHGQDAKNIAGLVQLETYEMEQFAKFLHRLKATETLEGTSLLDETAVLFGSGMGNANSHTNNDLPIIVAGGGYQLGEHRIMPKDKGKRIPLCNLYLSLLHRLGVEDDSFGTSSGTLEGMG